MPRWLLVLGIFLPHCVMSQSNSGFSPAQPLERGKILPSIRCSTHPEQSYALYLPSNYSTDRHWPIVISSDPGARGTVPLELQKAAAERYGYILAASNNSRNGPWKPRIEATDAMFSDLQSRVSLDMSRVYFAGFSGGARASAQIATQCKCAAGVLLSGAGFSSGLSPSAASPFPIFSTAGILDFNYSEVILLQEELKKAAYPHWLRTFDGVHQWAPVEVMEEALAWFRIQSMKTGREPRDQHFIEMEFSQAVARAESFQLAGDLLNAWREYSQIASTYDSLVDTAAIRAKAETFGAQKAVHQAVKREQSEFREQAQLSAEITSGMFATTGARDTPAGSEDELQSKIIRLRQYTEHEKRPERSRVYKRALGGVFIAAMESGSTLLEEKKYPEAIRVFSYATDAYPDSAWAWQQLAVARAISGERKGAISALRRARTLVSDKISFGKWLQSEHAFDSLRISPEMNELMQ
jgi:dienelactone hydrolase